MTKKEILLKQRNAENAPLTDYIGTDGYVWKMIENAMEEYHQAKLKLLDIPVVVGRSEQLEPYEPDNFPKCVLCKSIHDPEICCQD